MKRSEMLNKIVNVMDCDLNTTEQLAELILTAIETAGMLPPTIFTEIPTTTVTDIDEIKSITYFKVGQTFGPANKWEPES